MSKLYQPVGVLIPVRSGIGNIATAYTDAQASDEFGRPESPFVMLAIKMVAPAGSNCTSFDFRLLSRPLDNTLAVLPAAGQGGFLVPTFDAEATNNPPTLVTTFNVAIVATETKWVLRRVPESHAPGHGRLILQHKMNGGAVKAGDALTVFITH
jgi:hypothetical protein